MLGRFLFFLNKKLKDFQTTWANILLTIEHKEKKKYVNWEILHFYALNELISNLMPATGMLKGWKSKTFWKDSAGRTYSN